MYTEVNICLLNLKQKIRQQLGLLFVASFPGSFPSCKCWPVHAGSPPPSPFLFLLLLSVLPPAGWTPAAHQAPGVQFVEGRRVHFLSRRDSLSGQAACTGPWRSIWNGASVVLSLWHWAMKTFCLPLMRPQCFLCILVDFDAKICSKLLIKFYVSCHPLQSHHFNISTFWL